MTTSMPISWMRGNPVLKDMPEDYLPVMEQIEKARLAGHNYRQIMQGLQHELFISYSKAKRVIIKYNAAYKHVHGHSALLSSHKNKVPNVAQIAALRITLNAERILFEQRHGFRSNKLI